MSDHTDCTPTPADCLLCAVTTAEAPLVLDVDGAEGNALFDALMDTTPDPRLERVYMQLGLQVDGIGRMGVIL